MQYPDFIQALGRKLISTDSGMRLLGCELDRAGLPNLCSNNILFS
jgi:hypothetical protein